MADIYIALGSFVLFLAGFITAWAFSAEDLRAAQRREADLATRNRDMFIELGRTVRERDALLEWRNRTTTALAEAEVPLEGDHEA